MVAIKYLLMSRLVLVIPLEIINPSVKPAHLTDVSKPLCLPGRRSLQDLQYIALQDHREYQVSLNCLPVAEVPYQDTHNQRKSKSQNQLQGTSNSVLETQGISQSHRLYRNTYVRLAQIMASRNEFYTSK
jgi:hypothetical protein